MEADDDSVHSPVPPDSDFLTSGVEAPTLPSDLLTDQLTSLDDLTYDLAAIEDLAARGSWRSILENVATARAQTHLHKPHDHLVYASFNVLALFKLRRFTEALAELNYLGDLDSDQYRYETYPDVYMGRTGSMLPFTLRWLNAIIPIKLNQRLEGLDRLYGLLDFVQSKLNEKEGKKFDASVNVWKQRKLFVLNCIVGYHLSNKEFSVCLSLIKDLLNHDSSDPILISKLAFIQLQVGDTEGAERLFDQVEGLRKEGESNGSMSEIQHKNLVNRNKALIYIVGKDFASAVREYDQCIERDHADVVAINNKALCLMYLRDLSDSIKVLENALERVPTVALTETLVVNLCSMYELAYVNHSEIKRTLSSWIARVAPDDFDSSCTRT